VSLFTKISAYKPIEFLKKALSEQDGTPSLSRYTAFIVTFATIVWVTYVVIHTGGLPDLTSASLFIAGGHGGYVANKVSEAIGSKGE
jgi:hypothetical protein